MGVMVQNKVARFLWLTVYNMFGCEFWANGRVLSLLTSRVQ